jgi:hypothetical protein
VIVHSTTEPMTSLAKTISVASRTRVQLHLDHLVGISHGDIVADSYTICAANCARQRRPRGYP